MTDVQPTYNRDEATLGLLVADVLAKGVTPTVKTSREWNTQHLVPGERVAVRNPVDGAVLGFVTREKRDKVANVTDREAAMAEVHDTDPEGLVDVEYILPGTEAEVFAVLREHAPHLLGSRVEIQPWAEAELCRRALRGETVPGVQVSTPMGTTKVYPEKGAREAVLDLIRSKRVALDGTVLPPIEGDVA